MSNHKVRVRLSSGRRKHSKTENVLCTLRGIVNKLTPSKFDHQKGQIIQFLKRHPNALQGFVSIIFEKAAATPTICGQLCTDLIKELPPLVSDERGREEIIFQTILIDKYKELFKTSFWKKTGRKMKDQEANLLQIDSFSQELFRRKILSPQVISQAISTAKDELENICDLKSILGKKIEDIYEGAKRVSEKCKEARDELQNRREKIEELKQMLEACKKERDKLLKEQEKYREVKQMLKVCKKEQDKLQKERDKLQKEKDELQKEKDSALNPPPYFICPISHEVMEDPHIAADGFTYEKKCISQWLQLHNGRNTSPMTNLMLPNNTLTPNISLRCAIREWLQP